ncbi:MAG: hypothetical protein LRY73_15280 [Bacillus sp. (in: Bacteria)]|nr:hypothetical protein [Bacillus sp. (in: firmicutes)]
MKRLKNIDSDTLFPYIMTWGVILIVSALFVPLGAIMLIQDLLFFSAEQWTFIRPNAAYFGFGGGMIWIAVVLFSFLFTKMYSENKGQEYKLAGLHLLNLPIVAVVLALSIYHYAYLDDHGVQGNSFWTFKEESISWDEVQKVTRLVEEGSLRVKSYTFYDSETSITIPYDTEDYRTNRAIRRMNQLYDFNIIDIIEG